MPLFHMQRGYGIVVRGSPIPGSLEKWSSTCQRTSATGNMLMNNGIDVRSLMNLLNAVPEQDRVENIKWLLCSSLSDPLLNEAERP